MLEIHIFGAITKCGVSQRGSSIVMRERRAVLLILELVSVFQFIENTKYVGNRKVIELHARIVRIQREV